MLVLTHCILRLRSQSWPSLELLSEDGVAVAMVEVLLVSLREVRRQEPPPDAVTPNAATTPKFKQRGTRWGHC